MKPHKTLWEDQIQNAVWCGLNAVWWTFLSSNPLSALRCHLFLHRSFLGMALVLVWGLLWRGFGAILSPVIHTEVTILTIPYFFLHFSSHPGWKMNIWMDHPCIPFLQMSLFFWLKISSIHMRPALRNISQYLKFTRSYIRTPHSDTCQWW